MAAPRADGSRGTAHSLWRGTLDLGWVAVLTPAAKSDYRGSDTHDPGVTALRIPSIYPSRWVKSREAIKERLDAISQQASQAQWLLSIVTGVAGLFILAQGLFAFFSAQNYMKQAADAVQSIKDLETEMRSKFPMFSDIEEQWKAAVSFLAGRVAKLKFTQNLYDKLIPVPAAGDLRARELHRAPIFGAYRQPTTCDRRSPHTRKIL